MWEEMEGQPGRRAPCLLSPCATSQPHAFPWMMPALTFVTEHLLLSPWTSPRDSCGIQKEWLWGLGSQREQGDLVQVIAERDRQGIGARHPQLSLEWALGSAPAPLRHVFFSLSREQLDLKKLYICGCWILCGSLSRSCACDESPALYFRALCCGSGLFSERGDGRAVLDETLCPLGLAWSCLCQRMVSRSRGPGLGAAY